MSDLSLLWQAAYRQDAVGKTDGQLLERYVHRRDQAAFALLLRRHGPTVLGVCRRMLNNEADAEDAFQATFLILIGKAHVLTDRAILGDWLHQVARHTSLKARVAGARRRAREQRAARPEAAPMEQERSGLLVGLDEELRRLPQKYRLPVLICDLEGKTRRQAADLLGWPEGTVAGRLARGRAILQKRLLRGVVAGAALPALLASATAGAAPRPGLIEPLVQAAIRVVAGGSASGVLSANVLSIAHGVTQAMFWSKVKVVALSLLAIVLVGAAGGVGYVALGGPESIQPPPPEPVIARAQPPRVAQAPVAVEAPPVAEEPAVVQAPSAKIGEDVFSLQGHKMGISSVAFSQDGKRLASASSDGSVRVWDAEAGKELVLIRTGHQVNCVAIGPKQDMLASACADGTVVLWDLSNGQELRSFNGHRHLGSSVHAVAFSPDGKYVISGNGSPSGTISAIVWEAASGNEKMTLGGFTGMVVSLAYSRDGKKIVSASGDKRLRVWDAHTGKELVTIVQPDNYYWGVAFSPDGKRLVAANDNRKVTIWDAETGKEVISMRGHAREVTSAAFSPDGKLVASVAYDATLRLWDATTGEELDRRGPMAREMHSVSFSPTGRHVAAGCADGVVRVWEIKHSRSPNER